MDSSEWKAACGVAWVAGNGLLFLAWVVGTIAIEVFAKVKP